MDMGLLLGMDRMDRMGRMVGRMVGRMIGRMGMEIEI